MVDFWCRFFSQFGADFFTVCADFSQFVEQLKNHVRSWAMDEMGPMLVASKTVCVPATIFQMHLQQCLPIPAKHLHKNGMISYTFSETDSLSHVPMHTCWGGSCWLPCA